MNTRSIILSIVLSALAVPTGFAKVSAAEVKRPNIIFFLSDDHASQAIGCYGGKLMKTPNLDRLADAGMRFDRAFCTESICAPSRAAILTGKYGHISGAMGWRPYDRRHRTFPEHLRDAGYQTALVGKRNIGRVLDWLDRNQLAEDTIVIYSSDQGFFLGEHGWFDKRWMLEESLRMPLLVRYPRLIKPASTCGAMVLNTDLAPTLLDLAGVAVPPDMQGRSLRPLLAGERPADWRHSIYYRYYASEYGLPAHSGVRTERHKLIHYAGAIGTDDGSPNGKPNISRMVDEWELFDLQTDPDERVNLYGKPDSEALVVRLKAEMSRLKRELNEPE